MKTIDTVNKLPLKSLVLLAGLLFVLILTPFAVEAGGVGIFWRMFYLSLFCAGGYLLLEEKRWVIFYVAIAIPALIVGVVNESMTQSDGLMVVSATLTATLQTLLIFAVIRFSLYHPTVSRLDRVVAGICGYIILGLFWADIIGIVNHYSPDGFRTANGVGQLPKDESALYYSFVTLTTLGYGDISPANPWTRMMSVVEALSGTLYIAVLISSLVSQKHGDAKSTN